MNTQYITFILRLRLDDRDLQGLAGERVSGSLQQAGLQELHYFDSLEKLQEDLQQLVSQAILRSLGRGDDS